MNEQNPLSATLILEALRDLKEDIRNLRSEMLDRFEQVEKRFEQMERRMDRIEDALRDDRKKLEEVYASRDRVKITFGWQWGLVSLFIAIVAAGITKVFG